MTAKTKTKGLLEILSAASEFDELPMRHGEDHALRSIATHSPLALPPPPPGRAPGAQFHDPHVKANLLLQAHLSRRHLGSELRGDAGAVCEQAVTLLQALVDVISSEGWLKPALAAMEMSQMTVQALWADKDSVLQQVPHVTREVASRLEGLGAGGGGEAIETVFDLMAMDDSVRRAALGLSSAQLADVARFCNRYPNVDVTYALEGDAEGENTTSPGGTVVLSVSLTREEGTDGLDEGAGLGAVHAPHFPKPKAEGWWLLVGDVKANSISAIKRVALGRSSTVRLEFPAPAEPGEHDLTLYFMSDSYLGCDQEYEFSLHVAPDGGGGGGNGGADARMEEET